MGTKQVRSWRKMGKGNIDLDQLIEHFRLFNRTENKSTRTIGWYDDSLKIFLNWLQTGGHSTLLGNIDIHTVRAFIIQQQDQTTKHEHHPLPSRKNSRVILSRAGYGRFVRSSTG
jgi:site-specific recombinase XerD